MVKISIVDDKCQRRLVMEGKLIAPLAAELKSTCERARADLNGRGFIVDIRNLTLIKQEGENILIELMKEGVTFHCGGVFAKHVLREIADRASVQLQEVSS